MHYRYIILDWATPSKNWLSGASCPRVRVWDEQGAVVEEGVQYSVTSPPALAEFLETRYPGIEHDQLAEKRYRDVEQEAQLQRLLGRLPAPGGSTESAPQ